MSSTLPDHVGVYGGGRMGAGIAHALLVARSRVTLIERDELAADQAAQRVRTSLHRAAERGSAAAVTVALELVDRLTTTSDPSRLSSTELVIEAVPEEFDLKVDVLTMSQSLAPGAAIATNTSALSITKLANRLPDPTRLIGLHFFNPVPVSDLVEIVPGENTPPTLLGQARGWVKALGKTGIVVDDSPGFATSRLGLAIALEAIRMLQENVATAADIDEAMRLGYRHAMGPLRTTDIVGLDVRLEIAEYLAAELGSRFTPPQLLRDLVAAGHLGRKSGRGFYEW